MEPTAIQNRTPWIDFLRGLLIVLVVVGHSKASFVPYIYWFHIPVFFMLSGYLYKQVNSTVELRSYIWRKTKTLLIPYLSFLIIFLIGRCLYYANLGGHFDYALEIKNALYGGRVILGIYGSFWFITCFYATQVLYATIQFYFRNEWAITFVVFVAYVLAHVESHLLAAHGHLRPIPLDLDVALITVAYFHLGFLFKRMSDIYFAKEVLPLYTAISSFIGLVLLYTGATGSFLYRLDLKNIAYNHLVLDALMPSIFALALIGLSSYMVKYDTRKILIFIGLYSLPIMYLHQAAALAFRPLTDAFWPVYLIIGLGGALGVGVVLNKWEKTRFLFLGKI